MSNWVRKLTNFTHFINHIEKLTTNLGRFFLVENEVKTFNYSFSKTRMTDLIF